MPKRKLDSVEDAQNKLSTAEHPKKRTTMDLETKRKKWSNRQRILVLASRGISHRHRHLMADIKTLMPHHKPESKLERTKSLTVINEISEMKNCNKGLLFEGRKKRDLYLWMSNVPNGPCVKFLVENVYTMAELKLTGNCLKGSRPFLSFDPSFLEKPHYTVIKELLSQIFGVPNHHPKSQPFFDHIYTFTILDNRIWFRNFQILSEDGAVSEIGPRFVLNPVKILSGSFGGIALWENPFYVSPTRVRQQIKNSNKEKYVNRQQQKAQQAASSQGSAYKLTPLNDLFVGDALDAAKELHKNGPEKNISSPKVSTVAKKVKRKKKIMKKQKKQVL